jgi:VanZ family protein
MKLLRRHKTVLLVLGIYWPAIFWLTHIPVPQIARQSGMSDKTMHVLAYFVLTFLVWFAISPYEKVQWNKAKVWVSLMLVIWYGAIDEYLQGRVGRSADVLDFFADLFGMVMGLGVLSIFGFWPALLTVSVVFIFVISNMSNLLLLYPEYYLNTLFHFTAYTALTLIWIQYLVRRDDFPTSRAFRMTASWILPVLLLFIVKAAVPFSNHLFCWPDVATGLFGICAAVLTSWSIFRFSCKKKQWLL